MRVLVVLAAILAAGPLCRAATFTPQATIQLDSGASAMTFAIIGDWGRIGGEYSDGTLETCKKLAAEYLANPDVPGGDDTEGNACGGLEQLKVAKLMDMVCQARGCQFVVNTGDNFYVNGCFADDNMTAPENLRCANRFKTDWENVYNSADMTGIKGLKWLNSLGNHDVLGYKSGVDAQIAYQSKNPNWILPARWYAADVTGANTSVRFHVAHTSCFVAKYRTNDSDYYNDELISCSSPNAVSAQMEFLSASMSNSTADWNMVIAHHPALSSAGPSYFDPSQATPTADGWTPFAQLVSQYKPAAWYNGHDHVMSFQYAPDPTVTADANISMGFNLTGFHTSGAGSWPQAADGGHGLPYPYSFVRWQNTDLLTGFAWSGFAVATVDAEKLVVDYYSVNTGDSVPLRVTTYRGQPPIWEFAPEGLRPAKLTNTVQMNNDTNAAGVGAEYVQFRKLKM